MVGQVSELKNIVKHFLYVVARHTVVKQTNSNGSHGRNVLLKQKKRRENVFIDVDSFQTGTFIENVRGYTTNSTLKAAS